MRIGAVIRSYGLTTFLPAVLRSYQWLDKVLVMNHRFRGVTKREDRTVEIASSFRNTVVETGEDADQHTVLNLGLEKMADFDYVFISDADELLTRYDQEKLIGFVSGYDAAKCKVIDYAKDLSHRYEERDHQPIVIIKPDKMFYEVRCYSGNIRSVDDVYMHHFGYVYSPEEIGWKVDWEKPWEHDSVVTLLGKVPLPCEIPQEIKEMLNA